MTPKCFKQLRPKVVSEPSGRGEGTRVIKGYFEETVVVDFDAFDHAYLTRIECQESPSDSLVYHSAVGIEFSKGQMHTLYYITFREFTKLFGFPFPIDRLVGEEPKLVLRPWTGDPRP